MSTDEEKDVARGHAPEEGAAAGIRRREQGLRTLIRTSEPHHLYGGSLDVEQDCTQYGGRRLRFTAQRGRSALPRPNVEAGQRGNDGGCCQQKSHPGNYRPLFPRTW